MRENLSAMESTNLSDDALLNAARGGDAAALEQLLLRHQKQIFRFGLKMCGDPEDARDVLQESMLAVARSVRSFRGDSSLSTWLYSIARSFCIKKRRRGKFQQLERSLDTDLSNSETSSLRDPGRPPDEAVASGQIQRALENAMQKLDPSQREVLILRDVEGLTGQEVSSVLGIGIDAVKSRLHRARAALREEVAPLLGIALPGVAPTRGCPDIVRLFSHYLEGDVSPTVCTSMERHLESCPSCRSTCDSLKRILSLCKSETSVPADLQKSVIQAVREFIAASRQVN